MPDEFDLVILGGGPGRLRGGALRRVGRACNIAIVEEQRVGGTCLHRGCIPAKELLQTAEVLRTVRGAAEFGVQTAEPTLALSTTQIAQAGGGRPADLGPRDAPEGPQGHGRAGNRARSQPDARTIVRLRRHASSAAATC